MRKIILLITISLSSVIAEEIVIPGWEMAVHESGIPNITKIISYSKAEKFGDIDMINGVVKTEGPGNDGWQQSMCIVWKGKEIAYISNHVTDKREMDHWRINTAKEFCVIIGVNSPVHFDERIKPNVGYISIHAVSSDVTDFTDMVFQDIGNKVYDRIREKGNDVKALKEAENSNANDF